MPNLQLGFSDRAQPKRLCVEQKDNSLWHFWLDGNEVEVPQKALTGYVKEVKKVEYKTDYGLIDKLQILVDTGELIIVQSGFSTVFARGFLVAAANLSEQQLKQPLTLEVNSPVTGSKKVVFCNVYDSNRQRVSWGEGADWQTIDWDKLLTVVSDRVAEVSDLKVLAANQLESEVIDPDTGEVFVGSGGRKNNDDIPF